MNIVDLVKEQLTGEVLGKLGSSLGESEAATKSAANAAVPGILALLAKLISGGGAEKLAEIFKQIDLGSLMGGNASPEEISKKGGDILGSLLGGGGTLALVIAALSKFSGLGQGSAKGLLSYLLPLVLKVIAGQFQGAPTAQGLTTLFQEQKGNIDKALPPGLSLDNPAAGLPSWLVPVAALVLLGLAGWYFTQSTAEQAAPPAVDMPGPGMEPAPPPAPAAKAETPALPGPAEVAGAAKDLAGVYTDAATYLATVKDPASAKEALPKLEGLGAVIDKVKLIWDKLSPEARDAIKKVAIENLPKIKDLATKVLALPGVSDVLKSVLEALLGKLGGFA